MSEFVDDPTANDFHPNRPMCAVRGWRSTVAEHETYYSAYWFVLDKTGVPEIDEILKLIAEAGKAYHSTEFWNDAYDESDEPTYIERIQEAANNAARALRAGRES